MYMDSRAKIITKAIRAFDKDLFCTRTHLGKLVIMRKAYRYRRHEVDNCTILALESSDQYIMSLTHNWSGNGHPVDWGIEPILSRLRDIDTQNRESLINRMEAENQKAEDRKKKEIRNQAEDIAREMRPAFAKATSDLIVGSCKTDNRRKYEKSIKLN